MEHSIWVLIQSPAFTTRLTFSLWLSGSVTVVALLIGGGWAVWERLYGLTPPRWFIALCTVPLFLPPMIVGTGFIHLLGRTGDMNSLLSVFGFSPVQFLYTPWAVFMAHAYYNIPLAYLSIKMALDQVSTHTEDNARVCGAKASNILDSLLWPQIKRAVLGIAAIIFLYNMTSFALPLLLGGSRAQTLEVWLYQEIYLYHHYVVAAIVAAIQTTLLGGVIVWLLRGGMSAPLHYVPPKKNALMPWWQMCYGMSALTLLAPLLSLIGHTMTSIRWQSLQLLGQTHFFTGVGRSLLLAMFVSFMSIIICLLMRGGFHWLVIWLAISPITMGFIWLVLIGQGYLSLLAALLVGFLPMASYFIDHALQQQPRYLLETAQWLGANRFQQRLLELRFLQPVLVRVTAFGIVFVLGDVAMASLLAPTSAPTGMQVALQFVSGYHFALGGLALVMMLLFITGLQFVLYVRRPRA